MDAFREKSVDDIGVWLKMEGFKYEKFEGERTEH